MEAVVGKEDKDVDTGGERFEEEGFADFVCRRFSTPSVAVRRLDRIDVATGVGTIGADLSDLDHVEVPFSGERGDLTLSVFLLDFDREACVVLEATEGARTGLLVLGLGCVTGGELRNHVDIVVLLATAGTLTFCCGEWGLYVFQRFALMLRERTGSSS